MVATTTRQSPVAFSLEGRPYHFELCERPLDLSPDLTVRYWWMDTRQLRVAIRPGHADQPNRRSCTDLFWQLVHHAGMTHDDECQNKYLLARMYSHLATSRGAQIIYHDARLSPGAVQSQVDGESPLNNYAGLSTTPAVLTALDACLRDTMISPAEQDNVRLRIDEFLDQGRTALETGRDDVLREYLDTAARRMVQARKRGTEVNRWWLNALAHWSKVCFFMCYTQAWIAIRQCLRLRGQIDDRSAEFLRYWHFQQWGVGSDYGDRPLVLGGLPLAVHPVSGYLMQQADLRQAVAGFFGEITPDEPHEVTSRRPSYWCWTQAIVAAAVRYRAQAEEAQSRRVGRCHYVTNMDVFEAA